MNSDLKKKLFFSKGQFNFNLETQTFSMTEMMAKRKDILSISRISVENLFCE